jgi:hypothetical protein
VTSWTGIERPLAAQNADSARQDSFPHASRAGMQNIRFWMSARPLLSWAGARVSIPVAQEGPLIMVVAAVGAAEPPKPSPGVASAAVSPDRWGQVVPGPAIINAAPGAVCLRSSTDTTI